MVLTATSYPDAEFQRRAVQNSSRDEHLYRTYLWTTRTGLLRFIPERLLPGMLPTFIGYLRKYLPPTVAKSEIAFLHQTRHVESIVVEAEHPNSREEEEDSTACRRGFGSIPLIVLSEKWVYSPAATEEERQEAATEAARQKRLAALSSRGRQVDLDCGHLIPLEQPVAVIDAIREVFAGARRPAR